MARTSWSAVLFLGLAFAPCAGAAKPAPVPATPQADRANGRSRHRLSPDRKRRLVETRNCAACHHVPMPLWALSEAERQGYAIDKKFLAETAESLLGSKDKLISSRIFPKPSDPPDPRPQGRGLNMGLPFLAVAARSLPSLTAGQTQSLKLIAEEIVKKQQPDGSWEFFATLRRPPINESQTTDAAWIVLALQGERGPTRRHRSARPCRKQPGWPPPGFRPPQDKALKLLLGIRSGQPRTNMQTTIDELLALQRADGGWSQSARLEE